MEKISFKTSILQRFIFLLLLTVLSIGICFYYGSKKIALELADQIVKESTDNVIERTINYLNVPTMQARPLSSLVRQSNITEIHEELWKYMWEELLVLPQVQTIFIADTYGNYVQVRREPDLATRLINRSVNPPVEKWLIRDENYRVIRVENGDANFDPRTRPWYKNTQAEPRIYWTDVYVFTTTQTPGISASYPVLDAQGQLIAVTCINTPLYSLSNFLAEQKVGQHGVALIVNAHGELVAHPDRQRLTRKDSVTGEFHLVHISELNEKWLTRAYQVYTQKNIRKFTIQVANKNYIVNVVPFPHSFISEWQVLVVIPETDVLGPVHALLWQASAISIAIVMVSIILMYFFAAKVTKPITQLVIETTKIKNLLLDEVRPVQSTIREIDMMNHALLSATHGLQSFRKYVPADLLRQLIQIGQEAKLGGEESELTIMFSDIEGFTSISERMTAQDLMLHLSEYFENLTHIIMQEQGTIDKYIGDGIMAFWGAPVKLFDAPQHACRAILACQRKLTELNEKWSLEGKPNLYTRIGLHTGNTIVGNVGSHHRMNYTVIGDAVNLASRLEGVNKFYGTRTIISQSVYEQVAHQFYCRPLDIVTVKGKSIGIKIYELIAEKNEPLSLAMQAFCSDCEQGIEAYLQQDWVRALEIFSTLHSLFPDDISVKLLMLRCQEFQRNSHRIPLDWNGATILEEKF
ncbi:MAG: hypothetical protein BWK79_01650 [Beggiatoa sp. IS2]|nr:MAG: hypothetical protein BWK79_01650 [Beggiatoa sp. IS2]